MRRGTRFVVPTLAVALGLAAMTHNLAGEPAMRTADPLKSTADRNLPGRFGRMFPSLPPFAPPSDAVRAALLELGRPGGILDARDNLAAGPMALIADLALSERNPNNPAQTAGTTFLGQFLDHDMTFDTTSRLGRPTQPASAPNARRPAFDLDSVYGDGPAGSPLLYDPADRIKFRVEIGGSFEDLPRDPNRAAIIADPRNDENLVISGLQVAFLLFHNRAVDRIRSLSPGLPNDEVFRQARRLTTWHYQWIIVHEFLPQIVGTPMLDDIRARGRRFYTPDPDGGFIPVEFQTAYRFGHSLVRPSYRANLAGDDGAPFFALLFDDTQDGRVDPGDLRGGVRAPRRFIGWQTFFDFGDGEVKPNKRIDTRLSTPLFHLPLRTIASGEPPTSLAQRNLLRHLTWQLPSGQAIARQMGAPVLGRADLVELRGIDPAFETATPLWYYVLKEAEVMELGLRLGPVGGRIIGEVFLGLLETDSESYLRAQPGWIPTLATSTGRAEDFRMIDFLTFAQVDPAHRGQ